MTVTAADVQNLIVLEVGDTPDGLLSANVALIWESYADKAPIWPRLQELYAKRRCIDVALGSVRNDVNESTDGTTLAQAQRVTALMSLRTETEAEIGVLEARADEARVPAMGLITTTAPVSAPGPLPTFGPPDANDPRYSGSPYRPLPYGGRW